MDPEGNVGGTPGQGAAAAVPNRDEIHGDGVGGRSMNTGPAWPEPRRADGSGREPDVVDPDDLGFDQSVQPDPGGMLIPRPGRGAERADHAVRVDHAREDQGRADPEREFAVLLAPDRVEPIAPPGGSVPRLRWAGVMRVSGARAVQLGRHLRAEIRYRYRVEQVPPARPAVDTAWPPMRDFLRGRDLGRPVTFGQFARFRGSVRDRRAWPPMVSPLPALRRSARSASGFEIAGRVSVVPGDRNRVRGRQDLMVRRCAIRLGGLTHRADRLTADLFGQIRAAAGRLRPSTPRFAGGTRADGSPPGPWDGPPGSLREVPEFREVRRLRKAREPRKRVR